LKPETASAAPAAAQHSEAPALQQLLDDVELLAAHALELQRNDRELAEIMQLLSRRGRQLPSEAEVAKLTRYAQRFTEDTGVTADTLRATGGASGRRPYWTVASIYLVFLWGITILAVMGALTLFYIDYQVERLQALGPLPTDRELKIWIERARVGSFLIPFVYGGLGASAYLMRITGWHLRNRTFDPERIPQHINRLVLGTLSGGMIILFIKDPDTVPLSIGALGFLAGYSVDFLFRTLDRIIAAILPDQQLGELIKRRRAAAERAAKDARSAAKDKQQGGPQPPPRQGEDG